MITHIVCWNVKATEHASKEKNITRIKEVLELLPSKVKVIVDYEVGVNFNTDASAYDISLYSTFESKEDLDTYQNHPDHQKAVLFLKSVVIERVVVDYKN